MSGSRVDRQVEGTRGDQNNTLSFVGRVLVTLRLYGERKRGGGHTETGKNKIVDKEIQYHKRGPQDQWGGSRILRPSTHTHSQVLPAAQFGRVKPSSIGTLGRQPGMARHRPEVSREADGRTAGDHRLWWWLAN